MLMNNTFISLLQVARKKKPLKGLIKMKPDLVGVFYFGHKTLAVSSKIFNIPCHFRSEKYEVVIVFHLNHQRY